jgi:ribonuclease D
VENLSEALLITRQSGLHRLAERLAGEAVVAVDTESNSLHAYREQVCLVQFSTLHEDFLVDPLALKDLSLLAPIFENPHIEKVFHAAEYDLICLRRDFGFHFNNLFDTMAAARILGREEVGLGALLEAEFNVHLDKRYQRANWGQRPLPAALLAYAREDTHSLIPLRNVLKKELEQQDLWPLAAEDFNRLCAVNGFVTENRGPDCWRISGAQDLEPQQAAVLQELCRYRDRVARNMNRPLFKVLGDRQLLEVAQSTPKSMDELGQVQGISPGQLERHGPSMLAAVQRGLRLEPVYPPRQHRPAEPVLERMELLRRWRKETAQALLLKSDVILPRDLLESLAVNNPRTPEALALVMQSTPWRLERFGEQILQVIARTR